MKVLITGATGLIGTQLIAKLAAHQIEVNYLTTHKSAIRSEPGCQGFFWDPEKEFIDENAIVGVDAVIHLAGANVSRRWTRSYKQQIIESRVLTANLLYKILKDQPNQVRQFISASGISVYKDSLETYYNEYNKEYDDSFIANVVVKWEAAADRFSQLGISVCKIRTGLVLAREGGMLPQMLKPIRLGLGAAFGSGKQWQSWIHIHDLTEIYVAAILHQWEGVFNAAAPHPVTNEELTRQIAKIDCKPFFLPNVPEFVMKLLLGEMAMLLFASQKVKPERVLEKDFKFRFEQLDKALEALLQ